MIRAAFIALLLFAGAAQAAPCRLALLLALDVSSSVDSREDRLQREGVARALASPEVRRVLSDNSLPVAVAAFEWSGRNQQSVVLPWTLLENDLDIDTASMTLKNSQRSTSEFPTALGYAIGYAATLFADAPDCDAQTLDVAGDGVNNDGFPPLLAYQNFPLDGVTVNGLVVLGDKDGLTDYFEQYVIQGPGAFTQEAQGYDDYEQAMTRKLLRELQSMAIGQGPTNQSNGPFSGALGSAGTL